MKRMYEEPEVEVILLQGDDVITQSGCPEDCLREGPGGCVDF